VSTAIITIPKRPEPLSKEFLLSLTLRKLRLISLKKRLSMLEKSRHEMAAMINKLQRELTRDTKDAQAKLMAGAAIE
jgi:hypothetical protein